MRLPVPVQEVVRFQVCRNFREKVDDDERPSANRRVFFLVSGQKKDTGQEKCRNDQVITHGSAPKKFPGTCVWFPKVLFLAFRGGCPCPKKACLIMVRNGTGF